MATFAKSTGKAHNFLRKSVQADHKYVLCNTDKQLLSFERSVICQGDVTSIDTTFAQGCYVTFFGYENRALIDIESEKHPFFMGPIMLHEKDKDSIAMRDFFVEVKEEMVRQPNCIGSDDDNVTERRLHEIFNESHHLLGKEHLKWAIDRQLLDKCVLDSLRSQIQRDIFGPSTFHDRPPLLDAVDQHQFTRIMDQLKLKWERNGAPEFAEWFVKKKSKR